MPHRRSGTAVCGARVRCARCVVRAAVQVRSRGGKRKAVVVWCRGSSGVRSAVCSSACVKVRSVRVCGVCNLEPCRSMPLPCACRQRVGRVAYGEGVVVRGGVVRVVVGGKRWCVTVVFKAGGRVAVRRVQVGGVGACGAAGAGQGVACGGGGVVAAPGSRGSGGAAAVAVATRALREMAR